MRIIEDVKLDFNDVMVLPKRSTIESRSQVDLVRTFKTRNGNEFSGVPIIAANMATGTFEMLNVLSKEKMFVAIAKHHSKEWKNILFKNHENADDGVLNDYIEYGFYTIGMSDAELDELVELDKKIPFMVNRLKICIDIANGYTQRFASFVEKVRKYFPKNVIIAGNVATPEMVQELVIAGADFVKVGIGPSLSCDTRIKSGVGFPQWSAIVDCSDAAHGLGAGIVADGGCKVPGDIAKALCAGGDLVMLGNMLAGTDEQDGEVIERRYITDEVENRLGYPKDSRVYVTKEFKLFYGMSSEYAQEQHSTGMKDYRASEGNVREVPYVGPVERVVKDILGSLRSTGAYIGARTIKDFPKCATFVKVSRQK